MPDQTETQPELALEFDTSRLLIEPDYEHLDESHSCCVCNHIAVSPFQLTCGHYVCMKCIPKCKDITQCPNPSCEDPDLLPAPNHLLKLTKKTIRLDKGLHADIYCPYSPQGEDTEGCTETTTVIGLRKHLHQCQFAKMICPECKRPIARYLLQEHRARSCDCRLQKCSKCDAWVRQKDMIEHQRMTHKWCSHCKVNFDEGDTVHSIINCEVCDDPVPACNMAKHFAECETTSDQYKQHNALLTKGLEALQRKHELARVKEELDAIRSLLPPPLSRFSSSHMA